MKILISRFSNRYLFVITSNGCYVHHAEPPIQESRCSTVQSSFPYPQPLQAAETVGCWWFMPKYLFQHCPRWSSSGQFRRTIPAAELPKRSAEACAVTASQPSYSLCLVLLHSLPPRHSSQGHPQSTSHMQTWVSVSASWGTWPKTSAVLRLWILYHLLFTMRILITLFQIDSVSLGMVTQLRLMSPCLCI